MQSSSLTRVARETGSVVLVLTICVFGAAGAEAMRAMPANALSPASSQPPQGPDSRKTIQKVENVSRIRAATEDDRKIAAYYDTEGPPLIENGAVIVVVEPEAPEPPPPPDSPFAVKSDLDPLRTLVCTSAAIVIGQAVGSRAILNRSETFLVTDFEVSVSEWLRPSGGPRVIHVAMFGGEVEAGGRMLKAMALPLLDQHAPALLFLKTIPGTSRAYALHTPPVRVRQGTFVGDDFPQRAARELKSSPSVNDVLIRLREKHKSCGSQL
jgi:hypothetical protein